MIITDLSYTKNKKRMNIKIDGEFAFAVEENTVLKFGLYKGKSLTNKKQEEIISFDISEYLTRKTYDFIDRRPRSKKEVKDYLFRKTQKLKFYSATKEEDGEKRNEIILKVIKRFEDLRLLDDKEFAKMLIEQKAGRLRKSKRELEKDLIKYGVSRDDYSDVLDEVFDKKQQQETIKLLAAKKKNSLKIKKLSVNEQKKKVTEFLLRKGFSWEDIRQNI